MQELTQEYIFARLPHRAPDAHKGSCGSVVAVAGSLAYRGAAALCVEGALRSGAGLVYLAAAEPVLQLVLARTPECCALPCPTDENGSLLAGAADELRGRFSAKGAVLLAGPGLGSGAGRVCSALLCAADTDWTIRPYIGTARAGSATGWRGAVLDADALNALAAGEVPLPLPPNTIITPHPGEAARLLRCATAKIQADRPAAVKALANKYNCTAVLKGSGTLIAAPGTDIYLNRTGNAGLARGGSGDVLAGMAAAMLAQGLAAADAAACAVWLHGRAADLCAEARSQTAMLPHDILNELGEVFLAAGI